MAKAHLRGDDGDFPVLHAPRTADALVRAIAALYRTLPTWTGPSWRPQPAYQAIEAQIRALSRQHWALTSGVAIAAAADPVPDPAPPTLRRPWLIRA